MSGPFERNLITVDVPEDLREDLEQIWDALFEDRQSVLSKGGDLLQGETISGGYYPDEKVFRFVYVSRERDKKNRKWLLRLTETETVTAHRDRDRSNSKQHDRTN